tara:strand:- start:175 stop:381 length:207 start_codon:yes stop_codon:yes gene_type:complete
MANMKREYEKKYTFHEVIAKDDHSETVKALRERVRELEQERDNLIGIANEMALMGVAFGKSLNGGEQE